VACYQVKLFRLSAMRSWCDVPLRKKPESFMSRSLRRPDVQHDAADAFDTAIDALSRHHGADAFWCAGEDQVAGLKVVIHGQVGDQFWDIPDQLVNIRLLFGGPLTRNSNAPLVDDLAGHRHHL
jgi:hypothetical protein